MFQKKKKRSNLSRSTDSTDMFIAVERIKLAYKCLKIITYTLPNGKKAVTLRQAALSVKKPLREVKDFIRQLGVKPSLVKMQNGCEADMISLPATAAFWRYLNQSGKGNMFTRLGQEMLKDYLNESAAYSLEL